jgi:hypothetical protein
MHRAGTHLVLMMILAGSFFLVGAAQKAPCASEGYAQTFSGPMFPCYSDLSVLYHFEQLAEGRVPYLDPCTPQVRPCDEYPILTMFAMWASAASGGRVAGFPGFYWSNVAVMFACVLAIVWALERLGARTALFAAAPALALYGTLNWDLGAVAATTIATLLFLRRRDVGSGVALGIGVAAKLYPALVALPFALHRAHEHRRRDGIALVLTAAATWAVINLPFAILGTAGWYEVFRFNRMRGADYESVWTVACQFGLCLSAAALNLVVPIIVAGVVWWIWQRTTRRVPGVPRWIMAFPLLIVVIVTGKFWSPQYALWLLPWFALSRIPVRVWLAYQLAEVLEFMARTAFMTGVPGTGAVSIRLLSVTVALRAVLLLRCLWVWMGDPEPAAGVLLDNDPAPAVVTAGGH